MGLGSTIPSPSAGICCNHLRRQGHAPQGRFSQGKGGGYFQPTTKPLRRQDTLIWKNREIPHSHRPEENRAEQRVHVLRLGDRVRCSDILKANACQEYKVGLAQQSSSHVSMVVFPSIAHYIYTDPSLNRRPESTGNTLTAAACPRPPS